MAKQRYRVIAKVFIGEGREGRLIDPKRSTKPQYVFLDDDDPMAKSPALKLDPPTEPVAPMSIDGGGPPDPNADPDVEAKAKAEAEAAAQRQAEADKAAIAEAAKKGLVGKLGDDGTPVRDDAGQLVFVKK